MHSEDNENELIDKFLLDNLNPDEKVVFDSKFKSEAFRKKTLDQYNVVKNVGSHHREGLMSLLAEAKAELNESQSSPDLEKESKSNSKGILIVLLGSLLLALIAFVLYNKSINSQNNVKQLFAENFRPLPIEVVKRGDEVSGFDKNYFDAIRTYALEDYSEALMQFGELTPTNEKVQLYKAICHIELHQDSQANELLRALNNSAEIQIKEHAEWYLGLLSLKGDTNNAQIIFDRISGDPQHAYYQNALRLKSELDKRTK